MTLALCNRPLVLHLVIYTQSSFSLFSFSCLISLSVDSMHLFCSSFQCLLFLCTVYSVQCNCFHSTTKLCIIYLFNIVNFANMSVNNQEGLKSTHGELIEVYINCCGNCMLLFCSRTALRVSGCTWVMCLLSAWMRFVLKFIANRATK